MKTMRINLLCTAEQKVVGHIETDGDLSVATIKGMVVTDKEAAPSLESIKKGVAMTCARCHEPLYFSAQEGDPVIAMPGIAKGQV